MTPLFMLTHPLWRPGCKWPAKCQARYCPIPCVPCTQLLLASSPSPRGTQWPCASCGALALQKPLAVPGATRQGNPSLCSPGAGLACTAQHGIVLGWNKHSTLQSLSPALKPACVPRAFPAQRCKSHAWDLPVFAPFTGMYGRWG